jgi:hypothetical protein
MQNLVNFGNLVALQIDLREIASQIVNLKGILQMIANNKMIDMGVLRLLSEHKNLFKMYLISNGLDMHDFLEQINKTKSISTTPEQDTALIEIFNIFYQIEKVQKLMEIQWRGINLPKYSFVGFLELLSSEFKRQTTQILFEGYL